MMRSAILSMLCVLLLLSITGCAPQPFPSKPITIVCPWSAGGGTDRIARFWAEALQGELKTPCLVVNKTGGAGAVGHRAGAKARADGYTLTIITFELCTMHHMNISTLTYKDYECLLQVNADPAAIIVRRDAPWQTLQQFLDDVQQNPGRIKMSGTAVGGAWDLARTGLLRAAKLPTDSIVWVPKQGAAPSIAELLGGHLDAVCCSVPEAAASMDDLRFLAVMSDERLPLYPHVPTTYEQGITWKAVGWRGFAVPRGTPPAVLETLLQASRKIAASDQYQQFMDNNGFQIEVRERGEFVRFLADQDQLWQDVIRAARSRPGDPGPWLIPSALMVFLLLTIVADRITHRRLNATSAPPTSTLPASPGFSLGPAEWLVIAGVGVYVAIIPFLGFSLSTLVAAPLLAKCQGLRWRWSFTLAATMLLIVFVKLLFERLFGVPLPEGMHILSPLLTWTA